MFQKKKWQINILENQLVLSYSVQPKGIITQTLILVDLLWVCCCCCFEFESSLLLARNTKIIGGLVGVGAGRKKRGKQLMMTLCLEELGRVWVELVLTHSSSSHGFVSACATRVTAPVWQTLGRGCCVYWRQKSWILSGWKEARTLQSDLQLSYGFKNFMDWLFTEYNGYSRRIKRSKSKMRIVAIYYFSFSFSSLELLDDYESSFYYVPTDFV